ncbi:MAG: hypothetical protein HS126_15420 [Anaerolineales bacterium]|nr:hypothetical protein [Anaerolineales bacterium]
MKFEELLAEWVEPEVIRRKSEGSLPKDFKMYRCLIKLPKEQPPIIEFNDEISWRLTIKLAPGVSKREGEIILLHEVEAIEYASPPEIEGKPVAFVYLYWDGHSYQAIFDFDPSNSGQESSSLGKMIAEDIRALSQERAIHIYDTTQAQLQKLGLWAIPALLPYPLAKIINHLKLRRTLCF